MEVRLGDQVQARVPPVDLDKRPEDVLSAAYRTLNSPSESSKRLRPVLPKKIGPRSAACSLSQGPSNCTIGSSLSLRSADPAALSLRAMLPVGAGRPLHGLHLPFSEDVEPAVPPQEEGGPHPWFLDPEALQNLL